MRNPSPFDPRKVDVLLARAERLNQLISDMAEAVRNDSVAGNYVAGRFSEANAELRFLILRLLGDVPEDGNAGVCAKCGRGE